MKRKWHIILISLLLFSIFSIFSVLHAESVRGNGKIHSFTILQMNDVYELFPVPTEVDGTTAPRGGIATAGTLLQEKRKQGPTLVLHAGDLLFPSLLSNRLQHRGAQMIAAFNQLQIDLATFGNHEFDGGCQILADRLRESRFPWVSANVDLPPEMALPPDRVRPVRIVNIAGLRLGIFGLTIQMPPVEGCGPTPIIFREPIAAAREAISRLKGGKADLIIALTHLPIAEDRTLAETFPEIDFIVGGHDHEVIETLVGKTLITKAGANVVGLGEIEVKAVRSGKEWVVGKSWRRTPVDPAQIPPDPKITAAFAPYASAIVPFEQEMGVTAVPLDLREEIVRERESNFGNYVADVLRETMGGDAALINGGSFRDDRIIPEGPLTLRDLFTALPYDNEMVLLEMTGSRLIAALENGVSRAGARAGRFPQVSGLSFSFDPKEPAGSRVTGVWIGAEAVEPDRKYRLATTDFLAEGGEIDGYAFQELPILKRGGPLNDAIIQALEGGEPIRTEVEGRITIGGN
ncbi:MAG: 5'-nucleotidase C-terminal domain-containing protein [Candidatus Manganitrophaceae bacterium]